MISKQIIEYKPKVFVINDFKTYLKIKDKFKNNKTIILNNLDINQKYLIKSDVTIAAIPGIAGLNPTIDITKKSKKILLANKESIVCGWHLIKSAALKNKVKIIPVDSEHFSIMKLLSNEKINNIKKIYLTASGGPFLNLDVKKLKYVKPSDAIKHPKWKMGKKISIDSATLMNKMLELIEAHKLFPLDYEKFEIIIHPDSLIHAIIELKNGLYKFIYHETTMLIPLANAIFDDDIDIKNLIKSKNKKDNIFFKNLNFHKVNKTRFPIAKLKNKFNEFYSTPIIINAANEILVDHFLNKKIRFNTFYGHLSAILGDKNYKKYAIRKPKNVTQIFQIDQWSRDITNEIIQRKKNA